MYVQSETKHGSVFTCSITRLFRVSPEVARQRSYVTSLVYSSRVNCDTSSVQNVTSPYLYLRMQTRRAISLFARLLWGLGLVSRAT